MVIKAEMVKLAVAIIGPLLSLVHFGSGWLLNYRRVDEARLCSICSCHFLSAMCGDVGALSGLVLKESLSFDIVTFAETPPDGLIICAAFKNTRIVYIRDCHPKLSKLAASCAPLICQDSLGALEGDEGSGAGSGGALVEHDSNLRPTNSPPRAEQKINHTPSDGRIMGMQWWWFALLVAGQIGSVVLLLTGVWKLVRMGRRRWGRLRQTRSGGGGSLRASGGAEAREDGIQVRERLVYDSTPVRLHEMHRVLKMEEVTEAGVSHLPSYAAASSTHSLPARPTSPQPVKKTTLLHDIPLNSSGSSSDVVFSADDYRKSKLI